MREKGRLGEGRSVGRRQGWGGEGGSGGEGWGRGDWGWCREGRVGMEEEGERGDKGRKLKGREREKRKEGGGM